MIKAIVGANWGDEGKGKITDVLAQDADVVVRFQGGHNAGHTIINEHGRFALHMLPSGIFNPKTINILGNGVALNIPAFIDELEGIRRGGIELPPIYVSDRAQIVMPYHLQFDHLEEVRRGKASFGSTQSGIAPFYSDKFLKIGFQVNELFDPQGLSRKLDQILPQKNALLVNLYGVEPLDKQQLLDTMAQYLQMIRPYVKDTVRLLNESYQQGKTILMEGQLGALRDPDLGIYPYSTSSNTTAAYAAVGSGLPHACDKVFCVTKAYSSCVGAGPFVTELQGEQATLLRDHGGDKGEYGATTGRPRRVGWFDGVATRYGAMVQGATDMVLTNIDCLSYLDEIKVCVAYVDTVTGKRYDYFPNTALVSRCQPELVTLPGWKCDIQDATSFEELPQACRDYIDYLEKIIGRPFSVVSNGPQRDHVIWRR